MASGYHTGQHRRWVIWSEVHFLHWETKEVNQVKQLPVRIFANWSPPAPFKMGAFHHAGMQPVSRGLTTFKARNPDVYMKYLSSFPCRQLLWNSSELCVGQAKTHPYAALYILGSANILSCSTNLMIYSGVIWLLHMETKKHSWRLSGVLSFKAPSKVKMKLQMLSGGDSLWWKEQGPKCVIKPCLHPGMQRSPKESQSS